MSDCCERNPAAKEEMASDVVRPRPREMSGVFGAGLLALGIWCLIYRALSPFAKWFTFSLLALPPGARLASAVEFFVFDGPKVLMLLALVVFRHRENIARLLAGTEGKIGQRVRVSNGQIVK